ncbi:MAG: hypothetical protein IKR40_11915 [Treponema sp.]|nr:hypothetical protein [Treponema sp.]
MAAEVSAGVRLTTDVFGYDKASKTVSAMTIKHDNQFYHAPIQFSVSGEKAGATLKLVDETGRNAVTGAWDIWFKPIDQLKFEIGDFKITMNQEHIDWYRTASAIGADDHSTGNFKVTLEPIEGFSLDAMVASPFATPFFQKVDDADPLIKEFGVMMHYGADFGTISAMFDYKGKTLKSAATDASTKKYVMNGTKKVYLSDHEADLLEAAGATVSTEAVAATAATYNPAEMKFGAGYAGSIDPISFFVNVIGFTAGKYDDADKVAFDKIRVEGYAETTIDALTAKFWLPFEFKTNVASGTKINDKIVLGGLVRLDYAVGDYTLFLQAGNDGSGPEGGYIVNTDQDFKIGIKPGVKFSVGECAIEAAVDINATKNFSFSVPVSFQVNF